MKEKPFAEDTFTTQAIQVYTLLKYLFEDCVYGSMVTSLFN